MQYIQDIWNLRYFWVHLALSDLRARWRRSFFGAMWSIIQPLTFTLMISFIFSRLFNTELKTYIPYILSGIVIWDFISSSLTTGTLAFVQADAYIKQCKRPLAIYTLRLVLGNLMVLGLSSLALILWVILIFPENFGIEWLAALAVFPLAFLFVWPLATVFAYIGVRFRDLSHVMGLLLQMVWFVSPVYFEEKLFRDGGLGMLVDYNPVYNLLNIVRAPLLSGEWPTWQNFAFCLGFAAICSIIAILVGVTFEKKVIYYL